jgi:predicted Zn-dependent peptidase
VYKVQGIDSLQKKIDKPAITAIPTNRDQVSQFVKDIQNAKVEPIQPQFLDFQKDLTVSKTRRGLPLLYKQNTTDGPFYLTFRYDFGHEDDNRYDVASNYLNYLGTDKLTATQVKQQFYKMACNMNVSVNSDAINIHLSGLSENMPQALALLENVLQNAKVDQEAWQQFIALEEKQRQDQKLNQQANFQFLVQYGIYGPYNRYRNMLSIEELQQTNPQELLDLLKNLSKYEHTLLYYGPMTMAELTNTVTKNHKTDKKLLPALVGKPYTMTETPKNEILIAPYDAKNIYMRMYHNELRPWHAEESAVNALFNEYYGGGMNTIVFQEMREARGLAYNAYAAYVEPQRKEEPEFFFTHIITQNDKMMDCIRQFHIILDTIPQSETAFQIAKEALTKRLATERTTKFGLINKWLQCQQLGIDYDLNERIFNAIPGITLQDVVRFEQQNMARKPYRYIILGDEKELDMESLEKIAPIRRVSTEEIFGY